MERRLLKDVIGDIDCCSMLLQEVARTAVERLQGGLSDVVVPKRTVPNGRPRGFYWHSHPEFFVQVEGVSRFFFWDEAFDLEPGNVLVVPPNYPHREELVRDEAGRFLTLVIMPQTRRVDCHLSAHSQVTRLGSREPTISYAESSENQDGISITRMIEILIQLRAEGCIKACQALAAAVIETALEILSEHEELSSLHPKVAAARQLAHNRVYDPALSVGGIARELECSADHLSHLFHREVGETFSRYVTRLRLEHAMDLMRQTNYTISEVSYMSGFKNPAYFSRVFKKHYRVPPREYMKFDSASQKPISV